MNSERKPPIFYHHRGRLVEMNRNPPLDKARVPAKTLSKNLIAYGANTHNGIIRNYNEDRISIVLDLKNP